MKNWSPTTEFWREKRVVVTGVTGFKGAWLALWLHRVGARVTGISLEPVTQPNLYTLADIRLLTDSRVCDIRDANAVADIITGADAEIVFHLAAQALVRPGYNDPLTTFSTNVQGTVNVLEALRSLHHLKVVIAVTTDKVYREQQYPCRETDALGGKDPYSASKAAAEMVIAGYRDAFFCDRGIALASCRAGNVIGGGDWSQDRLIPDAIRAWTQHQPLHVRRPEAIRPWQHVLEPLAAYVRLAEFLWECPEESGAYNFGPPTDEATSVRDVVELARTEYGGGEVIWGDGTTGPYESHALTLENAKARQTLGIKPIWRLEHAVERTLRWYRAFHAGEAARDLCDKDIADFVAGT